MTFEFRVAVYYLFAEYTAFLIAISYTGFFTTSDFRVLTSLLPTPYSLLPKNQDFVPHPIENCYIC
ncbi:MAG: hypothetical protein F6J90_24930 [Moorea sp. SIOASIH]|uniref:hypothetical protein n=1 Tax=Moorena sp. SIOASIH TaxID=2607817 RepID=UPI0013BD20BE|nr:hypothetical protein [Moorena sp. SIOASIH]NEO39400.1 hypothetical protein [Moorena sp. SIOASIH]NEO89774.1 hypothetical protein [Moorena sp. SIO3G5]